MAREDRRTRTLIEYLDARLGKHEGSAPEMRWNCPACIDEIGSESAKPKLHVNIGKRIGHCFRCDYAFRSLEGLFRKINGGTLKLEELRIIRREVVPEAHGAVRALRLHMKREDAHVDHLRAETLPREAVGLWRRPIKMGARIALRYLEDRGVEPRLIRERQIHYCSTGHFAGYLLFPVFQGGEQVYFTTRYAGKATDLMKSNNPKKRPGYHTKGTCLLNYDAVVGQPIVVVVEGPFDAMAHPACVALMGKTISDEQVALLRDLVPHGLREVVVALDPDAKKFALDIRARLLGHVPDVSFLALAGGDPFDLRDRFAALLDDRGEPKSIDAVLARYREGPQRRNRKKLTNRR